MPPPPVVRTGSSIWGRARASRAKCSVAVDIEEDETEESVPLDILAKGTIIFNNDGALGENVHSQLAKALAKFAVVSPEIQHQQILTLLNEWQLPPPLVLISVVGSVGGKHELKMDQTLRNFMKQGLASAARSTNAWVFTGGEDRGVMNLTGLAMREALSRYGSTPCIGIRPWRMVTHREKLYRLDSAQKGSGGVGSGWGGGHTAAAASSAAPPQLPRTATAARASMAAGARASTWEKHRTQEHEVVYVKRKKNSKESAALDPNHTHFILVENGKDEWGSAISLRTKLEAEIAREKKVPLVLLVLEGGPGTYETVASAVQEEHMVVLVKESKGAAQTISEFIEPLVHDKKGLLDDHERLKERVEERMREFSPVFVRHNREMKEDTREKCIKNLKNIAQRLDLLSIFSVTSGHSFDIAMLKAIVESFKKQEKDDAQLKQVGMSRKFQLEPLGGVKREHHKCRGPHPKLPQRVEVPDSKVPWTAEFEEYRPQEFTSEEVLDNDRRIVRQELKPKKGWADPELPKVNGEWQPFPLSFVEELLKRKSFETRIEMDEYKRPRNPHGRTGLCMRGMLGKWGPNHAADPIVTRWDPTHPGERKLQMVVIKRKDTGDWAIPGGMVDEGETVSETLKREFMEEACAVNAHATKESNKKLVNDLFKSGVVVYQGYVDDPRNTDNAWMETTAYHFHCDHKQARLLKLEAGDDAGKVKWVDISADSADYNHLYASHRDWVEIVERRMRPHRKCCTDTKATRYAKRAFVRFEQVPWSVDAPDYRPPVASREGELLYKWHSHASNASSKRLTIASARRGIVGRSLDYVRGQAPRLSRPARRPPSQRAQGGDDVPGASVRSPEDQQSTASDLADDFLLRNSDGEYMPRNHKKMDTETELRYIYSQRLDNKLGRKSYEAPIEFQQTDGPDRRFVPLNPRGRTGLTGLGCLLHWGPNHMCECIITRFSPKGGETKQTECDTASGLSSGSDRPSLFRITTGGPTLTKELSQASQLGLDLEESLYNSNRMERSTDRAERTGSRSATLDGTFDGLHSMKRLEDTLQQRSRAARERERSAQSRSSTSRSTSSRPPKRDVTQDLEVLVFRLGKDHRMLGLDEKECEMTSWAAGSLPCFFTPDDPGCTVAAEVRAALRNEANKRGGADTRERLQHLLQETFDGHEANHIYQGYVDDVRNTDNAWIEMTVRHTHLSRELGGQLPFATSKDATWVPLHMILSDAAQGATQHAGVAATDHKWLETVRQMVESEYTRPGLLQLVVRWGRSDIAKIVLKDEELQVQRHRSAVQRAFQDALERSVDTAFDVALVETLLDHGADAAGVSIAGLWGNVGLWGKEDSFGYCRELKEGNYDAKESRVRRARQQMATVIPGCLTVLSFVFGREASGRDASQRRENAVSNLRAWKKSQGSNTTLPLERSTGSSSDLFSSSDEAHDLSLVMRGRATRGDLKGDKYRKQREAARLMTPWSQPQLNLMEKLVKGFESYGQTQPVVRDFDLMCWALVVGSLDVAHIMWKRTKSPLRAGLVAQSICHQIKLEKKIREKELEQAAERFSEDTVGVLNHITDAEAARKLLTCTQGAFADIGISGAHKCEVLDLAILLENSSFVSHRYCMEVMEEQFNGRHHRGGAIQLKQASHGWYCLPKVTTNDLAHDANNTRRPRKWSRWWLLRSYTYELWRIPRVKRYMQTRAMVLFVISFCTVAFQPLCGPLHATHGIFFGWLLAMVVQEIHQHYHTGSHAYWGLGLDRVWNLLDVTFIALMLIASAIRLGTSDLAGDFGDGLQDLADNQHTSVSLIGWLRHVTMREPYPSGYGPRQLHMVNVTPPPLYGPSVDTCQFTVLIDSLRSILGVTAIPLFLRLFELLTFNDRLGVLLVCLKEMANNLFDWLCLLIILSIGFSVSFSILTPNFFQGSQLQLADSAGPLRPFDRWNVHVDFSAGGSFFLPFWALYGQFDPGEFAAAPAASSLAPLVLWVYLMIAVVVFVNLLIAMFNSTYEKVFMKASEQWKMQRVHQIKAYIRLYPMPPPLNVPCLLVQQTWTMCTALLGILRRSCGTDPESLGGPRVRHELTEFEAETMEKNAMIKYLEKKSKDGGTSSAPKGVTTLDESVVQKLEYIYEWTKEAKEPTTRHLRHLGTSISNDIGSPTPVAARSRQSTGLGTAASVVSGGSALDSVEGLYSESHANGAPSEDARSDGGDSSYSVIEDDVSEAPSQSSALEQRRERHFIKQQMQQQSAKMARLEQQLEQLMKLVAAFTGANQLGETAIAPPASVEVLEASVNESAASSSEVVSATIGMPSKYPHSVLKREGTSCSKAPSQRWGQVRENVRHIRFEGDAPLAASQTVRSFASSASVVDALAALRGDLPSSRTCHHQSSSNASPAQEPQGSDISDPAEAVADVRPRPMHRAKSNLRANGLAAFNGPPPPLTPMNTKDTVEVEHECYSLQMAATPHASRAPPSPQASRPPPPAGAPLPISTQRSSRSLTPPPRERQRGYTSEPNLTAQDQQPHVFGVGKHGRQLIKM